MILLSIGHSSRVRGVCNKKYNLYEYDLCKKIVYAANEWLVSRKVPTYILDVQEKYPYGSYKISVVRSLNPQVALEFHLNGSPSEEANYSSCFWWNGNHKIGRLAAHILKNLQSGFKSLSWGDTKSVPLPCEGYDIERYWFVTETKKVPSMILEPLFLTNNEQAAWLSMPGSCEAVGLMIAEGVWSWLVAEKNMEKP